MRSTSRRGTATNVILSNPPYGGKLAGELQTNFTIRSGATEILFLQHIMANLAVGGRAAVIIPEGVLFRGGPDAKVRERLLQDFDVHTILSLPAGCFLPYTGVKTNVLFFDRREDARGTESVWYYELANDGFELKQTRRPVEGSQIPDFLAKWGRAGVRWAFVERSGGGDREEGRRSFSAQSEPRQRLRTPAGAGTRAVDQGEGGAGYRVVGGTGGTVGGGRLTGLAKLAGATESARLRL